MAISLDQAHRSTITFCNDQSLDKLSKSFAWQHGEEKNVYIYRNTGLRSRKETKIKTMIQESRK